MYFNIWLWHIFHNYQKSQVAKALHLRKSSMVCWELWCIFLVLVFVWSWQITVQFKTVFKKHIAVMINANKNILPLFQRKFSQTFFPIKSLFLLNNFHIKERREKTFTPFKFSAQYYPSYADEIRCFAFCSENGH